MKDKRGAEFTAWVNRYPAHNVRVGGRNNRAETVITFDEALDSVSNPLQHQYYMLTKPEQQRLS
jgi:hypothetical protein